MTKTFKQFLKEEQTDSPMYEVESAGSYTRVDFDLSEIKASKFRQLLNKYGLDDDGRLMWVNHSNGDVSDKKVGHGSPSWVFYSGSRGSFIATNNNPITGKYAELGMRADDKDYASYVSIYAKNRDKAIQIANDFQKMADGIKF